MEKGNRRRIQGFQDLEVYQRLYRAMKVILIDIVPRLPQQEKYDLSNQLRRSCKAPLALLAEGFAKRYQAKQWKKYIDDAIGEGNETINHLCIARDIYHGFIKTDICENSIETYNVANKQLFRLRESWQNFHHKD